MKGHVYIAANVHIRAQWRVDMFGRFFDLSTFPKYGYKPSVCLKGVYVTLLACLLLVMLSCRPCGLGLRPHINTQQIHVSSCVFNFMIHVLMALYGCMMCGYYSDFIVIKERVGWLPKTASAFLCMHRPSSRFSTLADSLNCT
jgi:hypothetical protein